MDVVWVFPGTVGGRADSLDAIAFSLFRVTCIWKGTEQTDTSRLPPPPLTPKHTLTHRNLHRYFSAPTLQVCQEMGMICEESGKKEDVR